MSHPGYIRRKCSRCGEGLGFTERDPCEKCDGPQPAVPDQPPAKRYEVGEIEAMLRGSEVDNNAANRLLLAAPAIICQLLDQNKRLERKSYVQGENIRGLYNQRRTVEKERDSLRTALEAAENRVKELEAELTAANETHCEHGTPIDDPCDVCLAELEALSLEQADEQT